MKFVKAATAAFFSAVVLAGCNGEQSGAKTQAPEQLFDVTCRAPDGTVTFQGKSKEGLIYYDSYIRIDANDGTVVEQGHGCTAIRKPVR